MSVRLSQLDTLPRIEGLAIHQTIGQGLFAVVKLCSDAKSRTYAVKFVHRQHAASRGITDDDIGKEMILHKRTCRHPNIVTLVAQGHDDTWAWLAMLLAEQGDLFDKIEPDRGVDQQVAHLYFTQLVAAVLYMHERGVAHRDLKPENVLLDRHGNLQVADFGLAAMFHRPDGSSRMCNRPCGLPPYMAPEIVTGPYDPRASDAWGVGVVLFVLASGCTPWDEPSSADPDYRSYVEAGGRVLLSPWNRFHPGILLVLRGLMNPDVGARTRLDQLGQSHWFSQANPLMGEDGQCCAVEALNARLLLGLKIDMQLEAPTVALSQPPVEATDFDFLDDVEEPVSATQVPLTSMHLSGPEERILALVSQDPAWVQFGGDAVPALHAERLTRFFSVADMEEVVREVVAGLEKAGVRLQPVGRVAGANLVLMAVSAVDTRRMALRGMVKVVVLRDGVVAVHRVEFVRSKGDPLEWRRLFKRVVLSCRDIVYVRG